MKCILIVIATFLAVQFEYTLADDNKAQLLALFETCKQKENVDDSSYQAVLNKQLPTTEPGKCLVACIFEETGMVKGNEVDKATVIALAEKIFADKPEILKLAKEITDVCEKIVGKSDGNRCEFGFKILECTRNHGGDPFA